MKNCKDCLHVETCKIWDRIQDNLNTCGSVGLPGIVTDNGTDEISMEAWITNNIAEHCKKYKEERLRSHWMCPNCGCRS